METNSTAVNIQAKSIWVWSLKIFVCQSTIGDVHAPESEVVFLSLGSSLLPEVHSVASV